MNDEPDGRQPEKDFDQDEVEVWPRPSQPDFDLSIAPDEPFRVMRQWERNQRQEAVAVERLKQLLKIKNKLGNSEELARLKELARVLGTEVAAKVLVEWASKSGVSIDLVMSVIRNLFP